MRAHDTYSTLVSVKTIVRHGRRQLARTSRVERSAACARTYLQDLLGLLGPVDAEDRERSACISPSLARRIREQHLTETRREHRRGKQQRHETARSGTKLHGTSRNGTKRHPVMPQSKKVPATHEPRSTLDAWLQTTHACYEQGADNQHAHARSTRTRAPEYPADRHRQSTISSR